MIEILNQQHRYSIDKDRSKRLLKRLIKHYKLQDPEVTLALVNNKAIKDLNRKFLNKDAPTDVLSFPIGEKASDGKFYLGDIIISVPQAAKQCLLKQHGLERELEILIIHGFLHLLGFEHFKGMEEEEKKTWEYLIEGKDGS